MKYIKWKSLLITCLVCLTPILLGIALWNQLPDSIAIHFNIYNEADNFASKEFAVFGLPAMMVLLQIICCVINDVNTYRFGERKKFTRATKWIIPILCIVLQILTLGYSLGWNIDSRRAVQIILGVIFLTIGNYLPKFDRVRSIKGKEMAHEKARKVNRFIGKETVLLGILSFICAFLPTIASIIWLILLIPYALVAIWYGVKVSKE